MRFTKDVLLCHCVYDCSVSVCVRLFSFIVCMIVYDCSVSMCVQLSMIVQFHCVQLSMIVQFHYGYDCLASLCVQLSIIVQFHYVLHNTRQQMLRLWTLLLHSILTVTVYIGYFTIIIVIISNNVFIIVNASMLVTFIYP